MSTRAELEMEADHYEVAERDQEDICVQFLEDAWTRLVNTPGSPVETDEDNVIGLRSFIQSVGNRLMGHIGADL